MKLTKIINAAIYATKDRKFISQNAQRHLPDSIDQNYYNIMVKKTGAPTDNTMESMKSWYKAYKNHMERQNFVDSINNSFKRKNIISTIIDKIFN